MRIITISAILFCLIWSCGPKVGFNKKDKFDVKTFNKSAINNELILTLKDGTTIKKIKIRDIFYEERQAPHSPFKDYKYYYVENNNLKYSGRQFFNFKIGVWNEYDSAGQLIKQRNWDEHYGFSIDDLILMMKNEFNIDIAKITGRAGALRGKDGIYYYEVHLAISNIKMSSVRIIRINGNSGKVVSDNIRY